MGTRLSSSNDHLQPDKQARFGTKNFYPMSGYLSKPAAKPGIATNDRSLSPNGKPMGRILILAFFCNRHVTSV